VEEVPPQPGEACGRDLRGADLRRWLRPEVEVAPATPAEAGLVAALSLEGLASPLTLPGLSPFPLDAEGAADVALAMRRGERFLLARCDGVGVGVVRTAVRKEFAALTGRQPYVEVSGLSVRPDWRRTGIGGRLLVEAEARAVEDRIGWVLLRTYLEVGLVPWYRRQGYEERLVRQISWAGSPTCLDVVMTRRVAPPGGEGDAASTRSRRRGLSSGASARSD
jgi:GNAT superfamily N-acetyltransferase